MRLSNNYLKDLANFLRDLDEIVGRKDPAMWSAAQLILAIQTAQSLLIDHKDDFAENAETRPFSQFTTDFPSVVESVMGAFSAIQAQVIVTGEESDGWFKKKKIVEPHSITQAFANLLGLSVTATESEKNTLLSRIKERHKEFLLTQSTNVNVADLQQKASQADQIALLLQEAKSALQSNQESQQKLTAALEETKQMAEEQKRLATQFRSMFSIIGEALTQHVNGPALEALQQELPPPVQELLAIQPRNVPVNAATSSASSFFATGAATVASAEIDPKGKKKELEMAFGTDRANLLHKLILMIRTGDNDQVKSVAESLFHVFLQQGYEATARDIIADSVTDDSLRQAILKSLAEELKTDNETVLVREKKTAGDPIWVDNYTDEDETENVNIQSCHKLRAYQAWRFAKEFSETGTYFPKNAVAATYFSTLWYTLNNSVDKYTQKPFRQTRDFGQKFTDAETAFEKQYNQGLSIKLTRAAKI